MNVELVGLTLIGIDLFMEIQSQQDGQRNNLIIRNEGQQNQKRSRKGESKVEISFGGIAYPDKEVYKLSQQKTISTATENSSLKASHRQVSSI